jgi:hypothetical protein
VFHDARLGNHTQTHFPVVVSKSGQAGMRSSFRRLTQFCSNALKSSSTRLEPQSRSVRITKTFSRPLPRRSIRWQSSIAPTTELEKALDEQDSIDRLGPKTGPLTACPGCGAPAQTVEPGEAGYYTLKRKSVSSFISQYSIDNIESSGTATTALNNADPELLKSLGLSSLAQNDSPGQELPLCNRCHQLVHHHVGVPIDHPSMDSLADTIAESPYKYNHIYHVIDAADFPMSLVKNIHELLSTSGLRSKNRRAKHTKYRHGKVTELSFIITRSDLLAPKKEQVDAMMPDLLDILRNALGSAAKEVRLGNVRCVSAKRGWWTKELKADVYRRGGGGWMVGKVNVGKSNLFEAIFPKGKAEDINFDVVRRDARKGYAHLLPDENDEPLDSKVSNEYSLLPPARLETPYPVMPTISSLPGTTASPIRIPFGNGKGELIDLPGLARSTLDQAIEPEQRDGLVMKARTVPEQYVIKPGQSLLLGGLVRITPVTPGDLVILAYPFTPLKPHLTSTEKAIEIQTGTKVSGYDPAVTTEQAKEAIRSAGVFELLHDVTRYRAGPLTTSAGAGLKVLDLPFRVLSADILVESVGWIELVAQVRRRRGGSRDSTEAQAVDLDEHLPRVEVFTPGGSFISARRPLNAWLLGGQQKRSSHAKGRPRKSMASERRNRSPA